MATYPDTDAHVQRGITRVRRSYTSYMVRAYASVSGRRPTVDCGLGGGRGPAPPPTQGGGGLGSPVEGVGLFEPASYELRRRGGSLWLSSPCVTGVNFLRCRARAAPQRAAGRAGSPAATADDCHPGCPRPAQSPRRETSRPWPLAGGVEAERRVCVEGERGGVEARPPHHSLCRYLVLPFHGSTPRVNSLSWYTMKYVVLNGVS